MDSSIRVSSARSTVSKASSANTSLKKFLISNEKFGRKVLDGFKLLSIVLPPIVVVMALCGLSLKTVKKAKDTHTTLQQSLASSEAIGNVVKLLAQERGKTCLYLTTVEQNDKKTVYQSLLATRANVTTAIENVETWLGNSKDGEEFANKSIFLNSIKSFRSDIDSNFTDCENVLWWYTSKINLLIEQMGKVFQRSAEGWNGAAEYLLNISFYRTPSAKTVYNRLSSEQSTLITDLNNYKNAIFTNNALNVPSSLTGSSWFDNMTMYINIIDLLKKHIENLLATQVNILLKNTFDEYYSTIAIIVVVLIVCPITTAWYTVTSKKMMDRIKKYATDLAGKTKELNLEKKKTDLILYQILPKSIVQELKSNKQVVPEMYPSVTIYFSDVQGFTTLSGRSTPFQVVELLNQLYTKFDEVLDQYDVYKVETIGDAYMVVSGVPRSNGFQHSEQICTTALHLLMALETIRIPQQADEHLLLRIGIHTGPCAAGVVGLKMPRYCLFGDTVTFASKMESYGQALRIHLSSAVNGHLTEHHQHKFEIINRGGIQIPGKGFVQTYWLVGKLDFPYRVNLSETTRIVDATTYWRC